MVALETESILSPLVNTVVVSKNVRVWSQVTNHRAIGQNLALNTLDLLCKAEIKNLVHILLGTALVHIKMVLRAHTLLACARVAALLDEAAAFTPAEHFIRVATVALTKLIAVDKLLSREPNWCLLSSRASHAHTVFCC